MKLNKKTAKMVMTLIKANKLVVLLLGAPGIGKSSWVKAMCEDAGWLYTDILCNQISMVADLTGARTIKDDNGQYGQVFFPRAEIRAAIDLAKANPTKKVILFMDEINRCPASVTSALLTFITARMIGNERLPDNICLIAAGNDDGHVTTLDQASLSRFAIVRCEPDADVFLSLGQIHPLIENLLKQQPALIFQTHSTAVSDDGEEVFAEDDGEFQQIATPRTIMGLNQAMLDDPNIFMSLGEEELKEFVACFTGDTLFTEALVAEILANKYKMVNPSTIEAPARPAKLDDILAASTFTDIQDICANLTDDERSSLILYMIYDSGTAYVDYVTELVNSYGRNLLMNGEMAKLTAIINNGGYNRDSYDAVIKSGKPLAQSFELVYGK